MSMAKKGTNPEKLFAVSLPRGIKIFRFWSRSAWKVYKTALEFGRYHSSLVLSVANYSPELFISLGDDLYESVGMPSVVDEYPFGKLADFRSQFIKQKRRAYAHS